MFRYDVLLLEFSSDMSLTTYRDGVFDDARVIRLLELFRHPFTEDSTIINALRALANLCNNGITRIQAPLNE